MITLTTDSIRHGKKLAAIVEKQIALNAGKTRDVAVFLSSGLDSKVTALAAHKLGYHVHAYTFQVGPNPSFDSKHAANAARIMGWPHEIIECPTDPRWIESVWPLLWGPLNCRNKREFECAWPFLFVYPRLRQRHVICGFAADAYFALSRKSFKEGMTGPNGDLDALKAARRRIFLPFLKGGAASLQPGYNPGCFSQHLKMQSHFGHPNIDPYFSRPMYDYMYPLSWMDLNSPRQKHVLAGTYPFEIAKIGWHNHRNYQSEGVSPHFEATALQTAVNYKNRRRVIDMARHDWGDVPAAKKVADQIAKKTPWGYDLAKFFRMEKKRR